MAKQRWLNNDFLNKAFTAEERKRIITTTVTADKNPEYPTDPGRNTSDRIFLLSIKEANEYFKFRDQRKAEITPYAKSQGASGWWWLRSPGLDASCAAYVHDIGGVSTRGITVHYVKVAVRPALWIQI